MFPCSSRNAAPHRSHSPPHHGAGTRLQTRSPVLTIKYYKLNIRRALLHFVCKGVEMAGNGRDRREGVPIHAEVLAAAQRLCHRDDWTFSPHEIVRALPHLNESSVRTHVVSRCCENAPENHPHRWPYFRRVRRGVYEILPPFRRTERGGSSTREERVGDSRSGNATAPDAEVDPRSAIHVLVSESEGWYVAECLEVAVVTQGRSLDETLANLRSALELHLDDEELARAGLAPTLRLVVNFETSAFIG